jgi:cell wall-associated NlpC family hydrolase
LRTRTQIAPQARNGVIAFATTALAVGAFAASPALAGSGGTGLESPTPTVKGSKAKLRNGLAIAPKSAPARVKKVIDAANHIAKGHPYCLGGGHSDWKSSCYDCSGAVSYALHGGGLISSPLPSGPMEKWGRKGKGRWITVYANSGHAFMKIAGLRFDTADTRGEGPGWARTMGYENPRQFVIRHKSPF